MLLDWSVDAPPPYPQVKAELKCSLVEARAPSPAVGYALIASSIAFLFVGSYAVFFSAFFPVTGIWVLDVLARDTHYKYLMILLIASGTGFVIANWVGWQYYRNS